MVLVANLNHKSFFKLYGPYLKIVISIGPVIGEAIHLLHDNLQYPVPWRDGWKEHSYIFLHFNRVATSTV